MTPSKAEKDAIGKLQGFCREYGYMAAGTLDHEYIYLYPKFNGGDPYIVPLNAVDYFLARNMPVTTVEPTVSFEELYKKDVTTIGP